MPTLEPAPQKPCLLKLKVVYDYLNAQGLWKIANASKSIRTDAYFRKVLFTERAHGYGGKYDMYSINGDSRVRINASPYTMDSDNPHISCYFNKLRYTTIPTDEVRAFIRDVDEQADGLFVREIRVNGPVLGFSMIFTRIGFSDRTFHLECTRA